MVTRELLSKYASACEIDYIGIAPPERFKDVPPQFNPLSILPEMKSAIVCLQEIPRGVFRGIEEGTLWQRAPRQIGAYHMYMLARYLEDEGVLAVPCSPLSQDRWPEGIKFREKIIEPNVYPSLEYAAVAAGLGEIGYAGFFISPFFGIRQSLGMLITDLEIEADEPYGGKICPGDECAACAKACPMEAFGGGYTVTVAGRNFSCVDINKDKCKLCPNGAFPDTTSETAAPNRLTAACGRACIDCLESKGERKYRTPFRRRPEWKLTLEKLK